MFPIWRRPTGRNYQTVQQLALTCLLYSGLCFSQPAYVIDSLWIGVNENSTADGTRLQIIHSGAQVNVETIVDGQARIETSAGVVGWVDASYLTEQAPLAAQLQQIELASQKNSSAIGQALTRLQTLERFAQPLVSDQRPVNFWLLLCGGGISITILAFFAGVHWRNRRLRNKFGGLLP